MPDFRQHAVMLADKALAIHRRGRTITLESIDVVGELEKWNAGGYLMLTSDGLAKRVGLTPSTYAKRLQAARVVGRFPQVRAALANGEVSASNVAIVAPVITPANADELLAAMRGRTSAAMVGLVSKRRGPPRDGKRKAQLRALLERALAVADRRGHKLSKEAMLVEALSAWLDEWDDRRQPATETRRSAASDLSAHSLTNDARRSPVSVMKESLSLTNEGCEAAAAVSPSDHSLTNGGGELTAPALPLEHSLTNRGGEAAAAVLPSDHSSTNGDVGQAEAATSADHSSTNGTSDPKSPSFITTLPLEWWIALRSVDPTRPSPRR